MSIACKIIGWIADVRAMKGADRSETAMLCYCVNWADSPSRLMTDREHRACRRLSRYCRDRLATRGDWRESDCGLLFV